MRILFVEPTIKYPVSRDGKDIGFCLGELYIASYLQNFGDGYDVSFESLRLKQAVGVNINIDDEISKHSPDVLAIGCMSSDFYDAAEILRVGKGKGVYTVLGGIFPSFNSEWILKQYPWIDIIVRGEGETVFTEVVEKIEKRETLTEIPGISYRLETQIHSNSNQSLVENLDEIPYPDYEIAPILEYKRLGVPASILTQRGCTYDCKFCSLKSMWFRKCRYRSVENVIGELDILQNRYGFKKVRIEDSTFTLNRLRIESLCKAIIQSDLSQEYLVKTRLDLVDQKLLTQMYKAGANEILFGIESLGPYLLESMGKIRNKNSLHSWKQLAIDVPRIARKIGYKVFACFVFSWPGETPETFSHTAKFIEDIASKLEVVPLIAFLTPHWGTDLHSNFTNLGVTILSSNLSRYTHKNPVAVPNSLGPNGVKLLVDTYNYLGEVTDTLDWNPPIDPVYLAEIGYTPN